MVRLCESQIVFTNMVGEHLIAGVLFCAIISTDFELSNFGPKEEELLLRCDLTDTAGVLENKVLGMFHCLDY